MSGNPAMKKGGISYPTSDGKPVDGGDLYRKLMCGLIRTLEGYYADDPMVHVSGFLLIYYEEGDPRKRVSPDVFVAKGVPKQERDYYLLWEEKPPEVVIELTSPGTRKADTKDKMALYQDVLKVREYFLFDPRGDSLTPSLQGYRLRGKRYRPIAEEAGRLPSSGLGLHLEGDGEALRLWNPATEEWLMTNEERARYWSRIADLAEKRADLASERADRAKARGDRIQEEIDRLLRQREAQLGGG